MKEKGSEIPPVTIGELGKINGKVIHLPALPTRDDDVLCESSLSGFRGDGRFRQGLGALLQQVG